MRRILSILLFTAVSISLVHGAALGLAMYRPYFLARDVEPDIYVTADVFFLKPWGTNAASSSYIEISTLSGAKYTGRLVKISGYEIALSRGYSVKRTGQREESQIVVPKSDVLIAKIYW